jgi:uncharacterized protein (DUF2236 family)
MGAPPQVTQVQHAAGARQRRGDGDYFTDGSILRRVQREKVMALAGPRALLMMAAHPVAFEGFFARTGALDDPYGRLERTAKVLETITYGPRSRADRMTAHVRAMHRRVRGTLPHDAGPFPAGTPYAADDPQLLLWILACLADSNLLVYDRYVRRMSGEESDSYWRDFRVIGRLFGLGEEDMPPDIDAFRGYMRGMLEGPELHVTERARELGLRIVMRPPVGLVHRPLLELANFITVGLLPQRVRRGFGLWWDPARSVALRGGAEYTRRVLIPLLPERARYGRRRPS